MLIVGCQICGEAKVLAGSPDIDGVARVKWSCHRCGTGQVLQLDVSGDARGGDLQRILGGLSLADSDKKTEDGFGCAYDDIPDMFGGSPD
jgi:ribosomal protein S27AE